MGTCFLYGNGGGSDLNFKVVGGTTKPSSPSKNTIWVNTGTAITGWAFSTDAPGSPSAGMVWICVGNPSPVEMNVLRKNSIIVYPIAAYQYISSAWVSKTAMSYIGGAWCEWTRYLYNTGDECTSITGGWSAYAYKQSGASSAVEATAPTVSRGSSSMTVRHNSSWEGYKHGVVLTNNSVDVTNFSTLSINVTAYTLSASNEGLRLILTKTKGNGFSIIASCSLDSTGVKTVNISSISGNYYVGIFGGGTNDPVSATFNKVYLS